MATKRKPSKIKNFCSSCKLDFASLTAFDLHRVGRQAYLASKEQPDGRRCLAEKEMKALGMTVDAHGRWRSPASKRNPFGSKNAVEEI